MLMVSSDRRLDHHDGLEPGLSTARRILLHVLPVLVQSGSLDSTGARPSQGGVSVGAGSIYGYFSRTCSIIVVHPINEEDDIARPPDSVQDLLEPIF